MARPSKQIVLMSSIVTPFETGAFNHVKDVRFERRQPNAGAPLRHRLVAVRAEFAPHGVDSDFWGECCDGAFFDCRRTSARVLRR